MNSPAPWKTAYSHSPAYIRDIKDATGELIAQVCDLENGQTEVLSNARLIEKVPHLLLIIEDLLKHHIAQHNNPTHAQARKLLNYVKGTQ